MSNQNFKYVNEQDNPTSPSHEYNTYNDIEETKKSPHSYKKLSRQKSMSKKIGEDSTPRNKLIEQHTRLKTQLKELAGKMDEIVEKQKERKKKKNVMTPAEEDERVQQLKKQLRDQQVRIQKNKVEISKLRRNLDSKYDINKIVEKENELKHLKKQLHSLEQEKQALEKIRKAQDKAIKSTEDKQTTQKISKMEQELRELTHKTKRQVESINQKQKQIRKLHEAYIIKEEKVKEIEAKAKQKKSNGQQINEYTIAQLEQQIKNLETERIQVEKEGNQRVRALERERKQLKHELERKKLILDEKEKELRLNQIKHKQIVRLVNSNPQEHSQHQANEHRSNGKRVLAKRGRQAPKIEGEDDLIDDN